MNNLDRLQKEQHDKVPQLAGGLDPVVILSLIIKNWYFFVIAILAALFIARFYIGHTMPVYRTSTTILINDGDERSPVNNDELLQGLGLPAGVRNLDNQIMILKSRELTERTLNELPYEIDYYHRTIKNLIPIYPDIPVKILSDNEIPLPKGIEFSIIYLSNNMFTLKSESEYFALNKQASFGEIIEIQGGSFRILCLNEEWFKTHLDLNLCFVINNRYNLLRYYNNRLTVESLSKTGSILSISLTGTNKAKDVEFLNKFTEIFKSISLDRKNYEANRRIQFIDDQLVGITDSLKLTENKLQKFRSANRVMDLSAQGQAIIGQVILLENERARLDLEANYYDYLSDYLSKSVTGELPIVPITMGIADPGLTTLVANLADLQGQLASKGAGEMNPLQGLLAQRVQSTKDALRETLNGLRRANSLAIAENQKQISKINAQASDLPATERQLLGFERKFKLNDELYTFLLEKRSEQHMQKASNMSDCEVIDPADELFSQIVAPNPTKIYFVGLFAGSGIPFLILFLIFLFNNKLKYEDISKLTDIPVVGNVPRSLEKTNTVALDFPNSSIAEAYRLLRSRMQFLTKEARAPVILITSSLPGDGKTYTAINLASIYSLLGKKTILVGFDLRKPRIFDDFNLTNDKGVSTWLIGKDKLNDIIKETSFENLSVITSGPVPPNPSELIALEKTNDLIKLLKESYDYIIIDSSPIGIVSDTYHLASLSDACLLVVRPGKTLRDMFGITLREIISSGTKGVSIVINDIKSGSKYNGYGEKYGYTSNNERPKRFMFFRKKPKTQKMKP